MNHSEMVTMLFKDPTSIMLTHAKVNLVHCALGIAGEAGEIVDLIKKHTMTGKELHIDKLVLEMGDIEFYLEALRQAIGVSREHILSENVRKLSVRYEGFQYSDKAAGEQRDKILFDRGNV